MNTDNSHVAGITIDYGPCAFMDQFVPTKVFSSIDSQGRYAYNNQAKMAAWNLAQLATALLPLAAEREAAIEHYTEIIHGFSDTFKKAYDKAYSRKIGYSAGKESSKMIQSLLKMMAEQGADYTQTFRALGEGKVEEHIGDHPDFIQWYENWSKEAKTKELCKVNPAIIPRNHLIEEMISKATTGDMELFYSLSHALNAPFENPENPRLGMPPEINEEVTATFCGT
jgi:uncharacterized protein YdiU (UPF0061 family)